MEKEKTHLLFVLQSANFTSRVLLAPADEFMRVRFADLLTLYEHAQKGVHFPDEDVTVANLLVQNVTFDESGFGTFEHHPFSTICAQLMAYADAGNEYGYSMAGDETWVDLCPPPFALIGDSFGNSFNHVLTYKRLAKEGGENIIDSFLVLESRNGELNRPPCDTVDEMMQEYFK